MNEPYSLHEPRKRKGKLRDVLFAIPVGGSIHVPDPVERNRICSGARNHGIRLSRSGEYITRLD